MGIVSIITLVFFGFITLGFLGLFCKVGEFIFELLFEGISEGLGCLFWIIIIIVILIGIL